MNYVGGKTQLAKYLLPVMLPYREPGQTWVEPFVGSAGVFQHVANPRLGSDANKYIVALLAAVRDGWVPPDATKEEHRAMRLNKDAYDPAIVGLVGFCYSFRGIFFGGYVNVATRLPDKHCSRHGQIVSLTKTAPKLAGSTLLHCDYRDLDIPPRSLIYCDPPYAGVASYKGVEPFDHDVFWGWAQTKASEGTPCLYRSTKRRIGCERSVCLANRKNVHSE